MKQNRFIKFIFSNFGYKLTALFLAIIVWYVVQGEEVLEVNAKLDVRVEVANGFATSDGNNLARDVTLRGPRVLVGTMQGKVLQAIVRVPGGKTGNLRYRLDKEFIPHWDNRIRLTIHDPYMNIVVEEKISRKIPIHANVTGFVPGASMIEEIKVTPPELEVSGLKSDISRISELNTEPIDASSLIESKVFTVSIPRATLPDVEFSKKEINVAIKIGPKRESRTFQVIPIEIRGADKVASAHPGAVNIVVNGPEIQMKLLTQKSLQPFVEATGLTPGRYSLPVSVSSPADIIVQEVTPKTVTLEIYNQKKLK